LFTRQYRQQNNTETSEIILNELNATTLPIFGSANTFTQKAKTVPAKAGAVILAKLPKSMDSLLHRANQASQKDTN